MCLKKFKKIFLILIFVYEIHFGICQGNNQECAYIDFNSNTLKGFNPCYTLYLEPFNIDTYETQQFEPYRDKSQYFLTPNNDGLSCGESEIFKLDENSAIQFPYLCKQLMAGASFEIDIVSVDGESENILYSYYLNTFSSDWTIFNQNINEPMNAKIRITANSNGYTKIAIEYLHITNSNNSDDECIPDDMKTTTTTTTTTTTSSSVIPPITPPTPSTTASIPTTTEATTVPTTPESTAPTETSLITTTTATTQDTTIISTDAPSTLTSVTEIITTEPDTTTPTTTEVTTTTTTPTTTTPQTTTPTTTTTTEATTTTTTEMTTIPLTTENIVTTPPETTESATQEITTTTSKTPPTIPQTIPPITTTIAQPLPEITTPTTVISTATTNTIATTTETQDLTNSVTIPSPTNSTMAFRGSYWMILCIVFVVLFGFATAATCYTCFIRRNNIMHRRIIMSRNIPRLVVRNDQHNRPYIVGSDYFNQQIYTHNWRKTGKVS